MKQRMFRLDPDGIRASRPSWPSRSHEAMKPRFAAHLLTDRPVSATGANAIFTSADEVVTYARRVDTKIGYLQDDYAKAYEVGGPAPTMTAFGGNMAAYTKATMEWGKKQPEPYQQWYVFKTRWDSWVVKTFGVDDIKTSLSFELANPFLYNVYVEIAKFDVEADAWAKTYEKLTGKKPSALVSSTPDEKAVKKKLDDAGGNFDWVKWAIVAGGFGVGLYVGWPWITAFRRRRALREDVI